MSARRANAIELKKLKCKLDVLKHALLACKSIMQVNTESKTNLKLNIPEYAVLRTLSRSLNSLCN